MNKPFDSSPRNRIRDVQREAIGFRNRAIVGFLIIMVCLGILATRFAFLQVNRHDEFSSRSDQNRISIRSIPPTRGLIFDRNGVPLAENTAAFRLEVVPDNVKEMKKTLADLGDVIAISDDDIERFEALRKSKHSFDSIILRFKLSEDEIARFSTQRWRFPGVDVVPYLTRAYPLGEEFAHVVGYVGRIDVNDAQTLDAARYAGPPHLGSTGIEKNVAAQLPGEPGFEEVEVNVNKKEIRKIRSVAPTPGNNVYLTVDARLQKAAQDAFEGRAGSAVAIDPRNGEVLAMVSVPSFDPNLFVNGIGRVDYATLLNAPDRPLLNRAIAANYTPGSTVKPYLGLGGLEYGLRKPSDTVLSVGEFFIPGQSRGYRDDKKGGHGRVDLVQAIAQSVNTYFYSLAYDMRIGRFADWMGKFGFGKPTGIDLYGEGSGVLPSEQWKRGRMNQPFYPGETVIAGIGQGYWVVTPIQLAVADAMMAARGVRRVPHLLRAVQSGMNAEPELAPLAPAAPSIIRNSENWEPVLDGMIAVVSTGTAHGLGKDFPYVIAGKTGTAERFSRTDETWTNILSVAIDRHQVFFEAFTPAEDARIAAVAALEAGHTGASDAAPIVSKLFDEWLKDDDEKRPSNNGIVLQ